MARGTGKTAAQMKAAAKGAYFVWCNDRLEYPKALAADIGRPDLHIVSPSWAFHDSAFHLRGVCQQIVVDHAFIPGEDNQTRLRRSSR